MNIVPAASHRFTSGTFRFLAEGKPHAVAAAFALGREHIILGMFRAFLQNMGIDEGAAPTFHYYLKRHIHLDADFHGPISLLLEELCEENEVKMREAEAAARVAVEARINFWDGVREALEAAR